MCVWLVRLWFLCVVPIPAKPIVADALSASIIGGIFGGAGIGIALRSGGSSGGMDIVGMFFTKKFKGFSVGRISLMLKPSCMEFVLFCLAFRRQFIV